MFRCGCHVIGDEILTSQCVLRHENTDDNDVCRTGTLTPSNTVDTSIVNERLEDEFRRLM